MKSSLDYVAGLYEGEGSVNVNAGCIRIRVSMTDREPLERLHATCGGALRGPYPQRKGKPMYVWELSGWTTVEAWFRGVSDLLSPRRVAQFTKALAAPYKAKPRVIANRPPVCGLSDPAVPSMAGHVRHHKRGEQACEHCYRAALAYMRQRRAQLSQARNETAPN
jgi:hypothetical protein